MYTLEAKGDVIVVSKPVWSWTSSSRPTHGATVSAELRGESLSEPEVSLFSGTKPMAQSSDEKAKLKRYLPLFIAARSAMTK